MTRALTRAGVAAPGRVGPAGGSKRVDMTIG
jgi:hypothetical protein